MSTVQSVTQQKRLEKIARLRLYFGSDRAEVFEWDPAVDEALDFAPMNDGEIAAYLKTHAA